MQHLKASTQYGDWEGTAAADNQPSSRQQVRMLRTLTILVVAIALQPIQSSFAQCPKPRPPTYPCAVSRCDPDTNKWVTTPLPKGTACTDSAGEASSCDGVSFFCPLGCTFSFASKSAANINPFSPQFEHLYRHGAFPTRDASEKMASWAKSRAPVKGALPECNGLLSYGGGIDSIGVTSGHQKVYIVIFGSQWGTSSTDGNGNTTLSGDTSGVVPLLQAFFKGLGTGGELWSGTMTQYCDGSGMNAGATRCSSDANYVPYPATTVLAGVWYDNSTKSPDIASPGQLATEAVNAAGHFGNTTPASNRYAQYFILSPPGTHPDGFNLPGSTFCAWHDYNGDSQFLGPIPSNYGDIAFTNMPYVPDERTCGQNAVNPGTSGLLDGVTVVAGHEYAETLTDQNPRGGWTNPNFGEDGDECLGISGPGAAANVKMGNGTYALQSTWSNDTRRCEISHAIVLPPVCKGVVVPDVTDGDPDNAETYLRSLGLVPVPHKRPGTSNNDADTWIYRQSPIGGTCVRVGGNVSLSIENKPAN